LLKQYETLEEVYAHVEEISGKKLKENLITYKEDAMMSKGLVTIKCDSPIEITLEDLPYEGYEQNKVSSIFKDLGFQSLLSRLDGEVNEEEAHAELTKIDYKIVDTVSSDLFTGKEAMVVE